MRRRILLSTALSGTLAQLLGCGDNPIRTRLRNWRADLLPSALTPSSAPSRHDNNTAFSAAALQTTIAALAPLHQLLGQPKPGDWLERYDESGQTFAQYRSGTPITPDLDNPAGRSKVYIVPLGKLTPTQRRIVQLTADYLGLFFGLPVALQQGLPLSLIPPRARRTHPRWGDEQLLTSFILKEVLAPRLPGDAAAYICFTAADLWPGDGFNFVYGQATLHDRVGVWSIYRNGDPDADAASFQLALLRTLKIAVHELSHMFSMEHCIAYACVMGGANNRRESDAAPLWLCPECVAKVCWMSRQSPQKRYRQLAAHLKTLKLTDEADFMTRSAEQLERG